MSPDLDVRDVSDLRLPLLGLAAWAGGLAGHLAPTVLTLSVVAGAVAGLLVVRTRMSAGRVLTWCGLLLVLAAVAASAVLRQQQVEQNPVPTSTRSPPSS